MGRSGGFGFHIIIIGICLWGVNASAEPLMVEVEADNIAAIQVQGQYNIEPYRERRPVWGKAVSFSVSTYKPLNYEPNFLTAAFDDVYGSGIPLMELQVVFKRNLNFGSFGLELSGGYYSADSSDPGLIDSSLTLIPIKLGAVLALDMLAPEPYVVPYAAGGLYTMIYNEENNSTTFKGNTQVAPYFAGGLAFGLDWIDKKAARISYVDSGIEASFLFIEARMLMAAGDAQDPDFSSDVHFEGGMKVEF